ncbi:MAG: HAMP domain-containing histidine kinase [Bacteroidales bacterium]|nr:MAG: HAMP domain-containing histidine kinase [Bacteroidales bacterium]
MAILNKKEVPDKIRYLQDSQIIGILLALSLHILFIGLFAIIRVHALMWFNLLISVPLFTICFLLSYRGKLRLSPILGTIEVAVHQVLAVLLIGQESGFQLLLFCLVLTGILFKNWKIALLTNSLISLTLYLFFIWFDSGQFVMYELPVITLRLIKSINCFGMFTIVGVILFYYIAYNKKLYNKLQVTNNKLYSTNEKLNKTLDLVNRQKEVIQEKKKTLEYQKEEISSQRDELTRTLENLERTQYQLIESEKLSALGGLVAGISHEINTPVGIGVTAVSNLLEETTHMADLYKKNGISRSDFQEYLTLTNRCATIIQKNLERTVSLVQTFKQVSVDQSTEHKREFNLKSYLGDVIRSLSPEIKRKNIEFKINCCEKLVLNSYPGVFAQVFTNLILNAIVHGFDEKEKGKIFIGITEKNEEIEIEFRDNGKGVPEEIIPKVFDPFVTSNHGKGTGLGLHIVNNLVTYKLKGRITCESKSGKGATFYVTFPVL